MRLSYWFVGSVEGTSKRVKFAVASVLGADNILASVVIGVTMFPVPARLPARSAVLIPVRLVPVVGAIFAMGLAVGGTSLRVPMGSVMAIPVPVALGVRDRVGVVIAITIRVFAAKGNDAPIAGATWMA